MCACSFVCGRRNLASSEPMPFITCFLGISVLDAVVRSGRPGTSTSTKIAIHVGAENSAIGIPMLGRPQPLSMTRTLRIVGLSQSVRKARADDSSCEWNLRPQFPGGARLLHLACAPLSWRLFRRRAQDGRHPALNPVAKFGQAGPLAMEFLCHFGFELTLFH